MTPPTLLKIKANSDSISASFSKAQPTFANFSEETADRNSTDSLTLSTTVFRAEKSNPQPND